MNRDQIPLGVLNHVLGLVVLFIIFCSILNEYREKRYMFSLVLLVIDWISKVLSASQCDIAQDS